MAPPDRPVPAPPDWAELRRTVDAIGRALAGEQALSAEDARTILEERARALSRPPASPPAEELLELVYFTLDDETLAVEARYVIEMGAATPLALLPGVEPPVIAVTAWRGALLTVLDLRQAIGGAPVGADGERRLLLVLGRVRPEVGVLVDAARQRLLLPASEVRSLPDTAAAGHTALRGITADAVLVLDGEALLDSF